ncbi:hypothetical protein [Bosea sp. (in: a-proteobacteria)]|uniref:hypothetical protein n=1 Tax=Bosea sp. (in: a-proteobacteria) TaxID=1871050 RepID=UPI001AC38C80|nr:hypothetical protein [Bosea sp. (in: a-proteobacteria)]MBN9435785.1 hypothetical protein [Bosea sp. (in: a-proteobacteria)]
MIPPFLCRFLVVTSLCVAATASSAFPDAGLRFSDDGGVNQARSLQQRFQQLGADRGGDVAAQAARLSGEVARVIGLLDLSRPAIPKAANVCSELLGPWYSAGPPLLDTNATQVDARTRAARGLTIGCWNAVNAHLFAHKDVIVTGMLGWIATWAAKEPIGTARGWCTGYGAQDNWWPLRSFYPDDLINAVIAGCTARADAVLAKAAEARIQAAIAAAERTDRTLEAMVAAKWLPVPDLRIGDPALARSMKERYEAAVLPIRRQVTDEIVEKLEEAYGSKVVADKLIRTARQACNEVWSKTLFSSQDDGMRAIDASCKSMEAAFVKRACKAALDKAGIETLGGPKLMAVPRANGSLGPVDYNTLVCAAAIDGFAVTANTSWFGSPSITIGPARGGGSATMKLRKVTREGGVEIWAIGDLDGKIPLTTTSDLVGCLATTLDRNDPTPVVRGLGFATGAIVTLADLMSGSSLTTFACRDAKLRWLESAS